MAPSTVLVPATGGDHILSSKSVDASHGMGYRKLHSLLGLPNDVPGQIWQDFMRKSEGIEQNASAPCFSHTAVLP